MCSHWARRLALLKLLRPITLSFRIRETVLTSQAESVRYAIEWAAAVAAPRSVSWSAILLVRIDIQLKIILRIPNPPILEGSNSRNLSCDIITPFPTAQLIYTQFRERPQRPPRYLWTTLTTTKNNPIISDTIFWIPGCRVPGFLQALRQSHSTRLSVRQSSFALGESLHLLCDLLHDAPRSRMQYFVRGSYDANSHVGWNPLCETAGTEPETNSRADQLTFVVHFLRRPRTRHGSCELRLPSSQIT